MNWKRVFTGVIVLAALVVPAIAAAGDRDSGIAEKWIAAWNSHSPDKMIPLFYRRRLL